MTPDSAALAIQPQPANPFANYDNAMLADAMGEIDLELKALEARRDTARAEMTRRHASAIEGARFVVVKAEKTQMRFSAEAAKLKMGAAWYDALKRAVASITFTVSRKAPAAQVATPAPPAASRAAAETAIAPTAKAVPSVKTAKGAKAAKAGKPAKVEAETLCQKAEA